MVKWSLCLFYIYVFTVSVTARNTSNIYKSSISDVDLKIAKDATVTEKNSAIRECIKGASKALDAFLNQTDKVLQGSFTFDKKVNLVGIGYSTSGAEARKFANRRCLKALEEEGINQVGIYSKYLKINTRNGYVIYAIIRTPVIGGFKTNDFYSTEENVEDLFK